MVSAVADLEEAARQADIIITATGPTSPLVQADWIQPGTHITAVGADAPGKQELESELVARADVLVVDLVSQCVDHGEVSHAAAQGLIRVDDLQELGALLDGRGRGREKGQQITIVDLTGIAAQDIAMANTILAVRAARAG